MNVAIVINTKRGVDVRTVATAKLRTQAINPQ